MLYINDPKEPYKTYDEVVGFAIKNGVEPKRVYIYLAALGVRGAKGRVMSESGLDYSPAIKLAVKDNRLVTNISVCAACKGLTIEK